MTFNRALTLARCNWPLYVVCSVTAVLGFTTSASSTLPGGLRVVGAIGGAIATWYAFASFAAFHIMFDRPEFLSGTWLTRCINSPPKTIAQLSVCVEETTLPVSTIFPNAICTELDLFDDSVMTEPAIARAKQRAS